MLNVNQPICVITGKPIPKERVEALEFLGVPPEQWTVVEASQTKRKKAVMCSENWDLMIVSDVGEEGLQQSEENEE